MEHGCRAPLAASGLLGRRRLRLPWHPRLSAEEIATEVKAIVAQLGATGPGDMGKVMGAVKTRLAGKADMGQVSAAVKAALANA